MDVDGVLANFNYGMVRMLEKHTGGSFGLPEDWKPTEWAYDKKLAGPAARNAAWQEIEANGHFWYTLPPYRTTGDVLGVLEDINYEDASVYYVTTRPGKTARRQTEEWLAALGVRYPNVIVSQQKGIVAAALGVTHAFDDKPENCLEIKAGVPGARVFLVAQPWNEAFMAEPGFSSHGLEVVAHDQIATALESISYEKLRAAAK